MTAPAAPLARNIDPDGRYAILGEIGRGAMGVVYKGFDRVAGRTVAIKTAERGGMDASEYARALTRFRREGEIARQLRHPNIVGIFDTWESGNAAYMVMEYVQGGTLKALVDRGAGFTRPQVLVIAEALLSALAYAHARRVVHRDLKPGNILMSNFGHLKISDFGIARIEDSTLTTTGEMLGTPSYMSPEQIRGAAVDARSDLFSAGVLLYELMTGWRPFVGESLTEIMFAVLSRDPPPLGATDPQWRPFDPVIGQALAKNPSDRFVDAAAFDAAMRAAAAIPFSTSADVDVVRPRPTIREPEIAEATLVAAAWTTAGKPLATALPSSDAGVDTAHDEHHQCYPDHAEIFREGEEGAFAFFIVDGAVEIVRGEGDDRVSLAVLGRGEVFGEMALLEKTRRTATAIARGEVTLAPIEGDVLRDRIARADPMVRALLSRYVVNLRTLSDKLVLVERRT